ncbi:LuxR C-terminal-related transcriptional regulator [Aneurinibacillus aneurinilyticus]|uniref:Uncharacterized protein n=1 Tax=Aneurinibacillus aneurinilyticus ATCC 12856 TaxID=649747 RepID=U1X323_ANEAE|nr:LuxR C-terminal-related transcriptional regulator [Aneurinibacillus aneurinilyticus]ERI08948.1 hypothetical protein HMPREF0083_02985 [Aneurinibacillus aneurinilyticus ATCC 12856]MED0705879.1 LuxR C-terminal-related transcriptional regulator [Aneurinibacillus aneurinilyticus]MED0722732.1 LuxR C-terminal-related transcriptional regulator [Aneurinibacillus aneurinilyticus]MED0731434.1 LuxR C-terminal-related transcriptional regulator [Aneurinibacillus aneurinilyticus]MED0740190.1 LuxR C-termin
MQTTINPNHQYIESVCSKCPGTHWGKSAKCRIHDMHIGQITSCQQWEDEETEQWIDDDGQIAFTSLEPALELLHVAQDELDGYYWMTQQIKKLQEKIQAGINTTNGLAAGTAQYGIEATLPKAKGGNSDPVFRAARNNLKAWERLNGRLKRFENKVKRVDAFAEKNNLSEKEQIVLEGIMDGQKMKDIAKEVGVSRTRAQELKLEVVKNLAWVIYDEEKKGKEKALS